MYEPLKLVEVEDRGDELRSWFAVDPDIAYPATIERIQEAIVEGKTPAELVENYAPDEIDPRGVARQYLGEISALPALAWELAFLPRADKRFLGPPEKVGGELALRGKALEWVRLWLTQALHVALEGKPMGVHILRREAWKI